MDLCGGRMFRCICCILTCTALAAAARADAIDVKSLGAVGDGKTLDTISIQKAIDQANAAGGGIVNLPAGKFLVGTILLKGNVTLHLDDNAEVLGTDDLSQYKNVDPFKD